MKPVLRILPGLFLLFCLSFLSCKSGQNGKKTNSSQINEIKKPVVRLFEILQPADNSYLKPDSLLMINIQSVSGDIKPDSLVVFLDHEFLAAAGKGITSLQVRIPQHVPGTANLLMHVFLSDTLRENFKRRVKIVSDIVPEEYGYRLVKSYPHDKGAYTQGLEYVDGKFYEGTGNYGESSLRKTDLETGDIIKYRDLSTELFGEGITRINGRIYQITYRSQVGFVYDETTFNLIRKIYYQIREGWGLTNNGEHILMSDGSHFIYYMDTTYFSVEKKIEVFDQNKEVDMLNELELINGVLYANRYTTEEIVMIDPESGKILGRIDMSGILAPEDRHPKTDYFNGIAWDKEKNRIFVTGKYWPKIYEVQFIKK